MTERRPDAIPSGPVETELVETELVERHLPLVDQLVRERLASLPSHVRRDELASAGMLALLLSARGYDPVHRVPFARFAAIRIRGALTDELRGMDWAPRSLRGRAREVEEVAARLAVHLHRPPESSEVAAAMNLEVRDLVSLECDLARSKLVSLHALPADHESRAPVEAAEGPECLLLRRERLGYLHDAVEALPDRLRTVVVAYFLEQRQMHDIASELGISQSRVSQLCTQALALLRDGLSSQLDAAPTPPAVSAAPVWPVTPTSPPWRPVGAWPAGCRSPPPWASRSRPCRSPVLPWRRTSPDGLLDLREGVVCWSDPGLDGMAIRGPGGVDRRHPVDIADPWLPVPRWRYSRDVEPPDGTGLGVTPGGRVLMTYFELGFTSDGGAANRLGHWGPQFLVGAILATIGLGLRPLPYGSAAGMLAPAGLFVLVLIGWVLMRQHDRRLCEHCAASMPLNAAAAAARHRRRLTVTHLGEDRRLVVAYLLVLIASNGLLAAPDVLPGPLGACLWAAIQSSMIYLVLSYTTHRRLQPWCPRCDDQGGGDQQGSGSPDPAPRGSLPV